MAVPHTGSEAWTAALGAKLGVERPWAPWYSDKQASARLVLGREGCAAGGGGRQARQGRLCICRACAGSERPGAQGSFLPLLTPALHTRTGRLPQVAGYAVHYKGLVYATVRGAGHMVPETKPAEALAMLSRFLEALRLWG